MSCSPRTHALLATGLLLLPEPRTPCRETGAGSFCTSFYRAPMEYPLETIVHHWLCFVSQRNAAATIAPLVVWETIVHRCDHQHNQ